KNVKTKLRTAVQPTALNCSEQPKDQSAHREGPRTNTAETRCLWCDTQRQEMRDIWAWGGVRPKGSKSRAGSQPTGPESAANKRRRVASQAANRQAWSGFGFTSAGGDGGASSQQPRSSRGSGNNVEDEDGGDAAGHQQGPAAAA
ncbi:unnamed protein product, partial [Ectocarpus fasciculatus]